MHAVALGMHLVRLQPENFTYDTSHTPKNSDTKFQIGYTYFGVKWDQGKHTDVHELTHYVARTDSNDLSSFQNSFYMFRQKRTENWFYVFIVCDVCSLCRFRLLGMSVEPLLGGYL